MPFMGTWKNQAMKNHESCLRIANRIYKEKKRTIKEEYKQQKHLNKIFYKKHKKICSKRYPNRKEEVIP